MIVDPDWVPLDLAALARQPHGPRLQEFTCPRCKHTQSTWRWSDLPVRQSCATCGGTRVLAGAAVYIITRLLLPRGEPLAPRRFRPWSRPLTCTTCRRPMDRTRVRGVTLDYCTGCSAVWFDPGELDAFVPRARTPAPCPRCPGVFLNEDEGLLGADACPRCRGQLLDACGTAQVLCEERGISIAELKTRVRAAVRGVTCPDCRRAMFHVDLDGAVVDVCATCGNAWLDGDDVEKVTGGRHG